MGKVIIKTALKTLLILILAAAAAFAVASFGFPQHMTTFFENTEMYTIAAKYASLRYSYTGDVDDAARCAEDAIRSGDSEEIVKYGAVLINHNDFGEYCARMDESYASGKYAEYTISYKQYIYGKYAIALASCGEKEEAVEQALAANGLSGFESGNALSSLALWAISNQDSETCALIESAMEKISVPDEDLERYQTILQSVKDAAA